MDKDFFIMMNHPSKEARPTPIVDEEGDVVFFESEEAATTAAEEHFWASKTGYEVFELGCGC